MGFVELIVVVLFGIFTYNKINEKGKIANWSWWRVTSPLWLYMIFALVIYVLFFGFFGAMFLAMPTG